MEHGPFTVVDSESGDGSFAFLKNKYSWSEAADVLYVEQPIRTGFSLASESGRTIKKEKQVAQDFAKFLQSMMEVFPEYQNNPLFIAGESYAGFYVPWISQHILQLKHSKNEEERASMARVELQGVAIGNGAIDYAIQEPSYAEYAYYHGLIPLGAKDRLEEEWGRCMDSFQQDRSKHFLTVGDFDKCDLMGKVSATSYYSYIYVCILTSCLCLSYHHHLP
jgi:carboxypeptidase C (cathepsin A)